MLGRASLRCRMLGLLAALLVLLTRYALGLAPTDDCPGDWLPPDCKQNMNLATSYLPPPQQPQPTTRGGLRSGAGSPLHHRKARERRLLLATLQRNQLALPAGSCLQLQPVQLDPVPYLATPSAGWPPLLPALIAKDCAQSPASLLAFCNTTTARPLKIVDYGYGSELHYAMRAVDEGLRDGYSVYPIGKLNLAESEDWCGNNHLCFFEPYYWPGCGNASSNPSPEKKWPLASQDPVELAPWVAPPAFSSLGVFEFRALTAAFIHRPSAAMRARVRQVAERIGRNFSEPCIGVHIRRGDSCSDAEAHRECFSNDKYVEAIQRVRERYSIHCAYIATDDGSAPAAIQAAFSQRDAAAAAAAQSPSQPLPLGWRPLKVIEQKNDRSLYNKCPNGLCETKGGKKVYLENERHLYRGEQGFRLGADMLVDIELLASCTAFVGAMSSNNFRLAIELAYARRDAHPPFVSLDTSWCWFGFGEQRIAGRKHAMAC